MKSKRNDLIIIIASKTSSPTRSNRFNKHILSTFAKSNIQKLEILWSLSLRDWHFSRWSVTDTELSLIYQVSTMRTINIECYGNMQMGHQTQNCHEGNKVSGICLILAEELSLIGVA